MCKESTTMTITVLLLLRFMIQTVMNIDVVYVFMRACRTEPSCVHDNATHL